MSLKLAIEFSNGFRWLKELDQGPESPLERFIRKIKRILGLL